MYAHPKLDPLFLGHLSIALGHPALNLNGTPNCIHHTGELDQHTVPGGLHDPTTVLGDLGVNESAAVGLELREGSLLVSAHQAAISSHVGCQDGGKASFYAIRGQGCTPG